MNNNINLTTANVMNASEIISSTGLIDIESAKTLRDINSRISTKCAHLGEVSSDLAVMVKNSFFSAFNEYLSGKAWMNYGGKELTKIEFEKIVLTYNNLVNEKSDLLKEIDELKSASLAFKIPSEYLDLMEEV